MYLVFSSMQLKNFDNIKIIYIQCIQFIWKYIDIKYEYYKFNKIISNLLINCSLCT